MIVTSMPSSLGELIEQLGGVSPFRVRMRPAPGTATEADLLAIKATENRVCELIDGTVVEKPMGYRESVLALAIASALRSFVIPHKLGLISGPDGMLRLAPELVRTPDVAFVSRDRLPGGHMPAAAIPQLVPDLAAEVLSESNTSREMLRKRQDYFNAGVRVVWLFDPDARIVEVYTAIDHPVILHEHDTLGGGAVLPGLAIELKPLFAEMDI